MFYNIDSILKSELRKEPWEHKVVDNSINPEVFKTLSLIPKMILNKNRRGTPLMAKFIHESKVDDEGAIMDLKTLLDVGLAENMVELLYDCGKSFFDAKDQILEQFSSHQKSSDGEYLFDVNLQFLFPGNEVSLHDGGYNKTLSCVTCLSPDIQSGTRLGDSTEVEWKKNRSIIFAPHRGVTCTSYKNPYEMQSFRFVITTFVEFVEYKNIEFSNGKKFKFLTGSK
jgi:hypothetical protein